ncbi:MAG TPA: carboxypeptidase-like regulatory domain-containing protein [Methylomirabilota bacterium]|nr:carboxypeptidase-like regulatory domain-containing protein [Methylomirabilota bacterium]
MMTVGAVTPAEQVAVRASHTAVIDVVVFPEDGEARGEPVSVDVRTNPDADPIATVSCGLGLECTLEIPSTTAPLIVSAEPPGFWPEQEAVLLNERGRAKVRLSLRRTGVVRGKLKVSERDTMPKTLLLAFNAVHAAPGRMEPLSGELAQPVEQGSFEFRIPKGRQNLKLRAKGFVSRFFWNVEIAPEKPLDLKTVEMKPGSSVVGRVAKLDQEGRFDDVVISLEPVSDPLRADQVEQGRFAATEAIAGSRGFFIFDDVLPGTYEVRAEDSTGASASFSPLVVYDGSESEIARPLTLQPPASVEIWVTPFTDLEGSPWTIELARLHAMPGRLEEVASKTTDEVGIARFEDIPFGDYKVSAISSGGERWLFEDRRVSNSDEVLTLTLDQEWVEGTVNYGDEPLTADLWFGGFTGAVRAHLVSDASGEFEGFLPRRGEWLVELKSEEAGVRRQLMVTVGTSPVEIVLPANELCGKVVDGADRAVEGAEVTGLPVDHFEHPVVTRTAADGRFRFAGLEPGRIRLTAKHEGRVSAVVEHAVTSGDAVDAGDGGPVLVLRDREVVDGRVLGVAGGVFGSIVTVWPTAEDMTAGGVGTTDFEGRFRIRLATQPNGNERALDFILLPPGHVLRSGRVRIRSGEDLVLDATAPGGELVIDAGDLTARDVLPMVLHNGVMINLPTLLKWAHVNGSPIDPVEQVLRFPRVEVGEWSLCAVKMSELAVALGGDRSLLRCDRGLVTPGGSVLLRMPR